MNWIALYMQGIQLPSSLSLLSFFGLFLGVYYVDFLNVRWQNWKESLDGNGDLYNDFPNFKVLFMKSFKLVVMKLILKKKIEMYQNGELLTMAQYPYCCIKRK